MAGPQQRDFSDETAAVVDAEVRRIVDEMFQRAVAILEQRRPILHALARRLLEKETLDEGELRDGLTAGAAVQSA